MENPYIKFNGIVESTVFPTDWGKDYEVVSGLGMLFTFSLRDFEHSHEWVFIEIFSLYQNRKCQRKPSKTWMLPRNEPESIIPIVNRLGLLEQSLHMAVANLFLPSICAVV